MREVLFWCSLMTLFSIHPLKNTKADEYNSEPVNRADTEPKSIQIAVHHFHHYVGGPKHGGPVKTRLPNRNAPPHRGRSFPPGYRKRHAHIPVRPPIPRKFVQFERKKKCYDVYKRKILTKPLGKPIVTIKHYSG